MKKLLIMFYFSLVFFVLLITCQKAYAVTEKYRLPAGLKRIEDEAFMNDHIIVDVLIIPDGVEIIGSKAFANCKISSIVFSNSVSYIADDAFENAEVETVYAEQDSYASTWVFGKECGLFTYISNEGRSECTIIGYDGDGAQCINIPPEIGGLLVTAIGDYVFCDHKEITNVRLPATVKDLGEGVFFGCDHLEEVNLPSGITIINTGLFEFCERLENILIPPSIKEIRDNAFTDCKRLGNIDIPNGVISIGNEAFFGCNGISSVRLPDNLQTLGYSAFMDCKNLESINLPAGLQIIRPQSFCGCEKLHGIDLPNSIVCIERAAFLDCKNLSSIALPSAVTEIGDSTFSGCKNLQSITLPYGIETIRGSTFADCSSLTSIVIPSSVKTIEWHAFDGCSNLVRVWMPKSVIEIPGWALFDGCYKLRYIYGEADSLAEYYADVWNCDFISAHRIGNENEDCYYYSVPSRIYMGIGQALKPLIFSDGKDHDYILTCEDKTILTTRLNTIIAKDFGSTKVHIVMPEGNIDVDITVSVIMDMDFEIQNLSQFEHISLNEISHFNMITEDINIDSPRWESNNPVNMRPIISVVNDEVYAVNEGTVMITASFHIQSEEDTNEEIKVSASITVIKITDIDIENEYYKQLSMCSLDEDPLKNPIVYDIIYGVLCDFAGQSFADVVLRDVSNSESMWRNLYIYSFFDYNLIANTSGRVEFAPEDNAIHINTNDEDLIIDYFHEVGHAIDYNTLKTGTFLTDLSIEFPQKLVNDSFRWLSSKVAQSDNELSEYEVEIIVAALLDERNKNTTITIESGKVKIDVQDPVDIPEECKEIYKKSVKQIVGDLYKEMSFVSNGVQPYHKNNCMCGDFLCGTTNAAIHYGFGHGKPIDGDEDYWYKNGVWTSNQVREVWADFFSCMMTGIPDTRKMNESMCFESFYYCYEVITDTAYKEYVDRIRIID